MRVKTVSLAKDSNSCIPRHIDPMKSDTLAKYFLYFT